MPKPPHSQRGRRPKPQVAPASIPSRTARSHKSEIVAGVGGIASWFGSLASWFFSTALQLSGIQSRVAACGMLAIGAALFIYAIRHYFQQMKAKYWASASVVVLTGVGAWWLLTHSAQSENCPPGQAVCIQNSSNGVLKNFTIDGDSYPNGGIEMKDSHDITIKDFDIDDGKKKDATK